MVETKTKLPVWYFNWKEELERRLVAGSRVVDTMSGSIEYAVKGNEGPVITGIHGSPGGYDQVFAHFPGLIGRGFRFLAWSRPGYLRTPITVGRTFEQQADALANLLDHFKVKRTGIIANSTGGPIALQFAIRHPDRVFALVLESCVSQKYYVNSGKKSEKVLSKLTFNDPTIWLYNVFAKYASFSVVKSMVKMESDYDAKRVDEITNNIMSNNDKLAYIFNLIKSMSPIGIRKVGLENDIIQNSNIENFDLSKISCPTMIIHGKHDADVTLHHAGYLATNIPHAEKLIVEDGFHILPVSNSYMDVHKKRLQFLNKHRPY